jgi:hypothetical protein
MVPTDAGIFMIGLWLETALWALDCLAESIR